MNLCAVRSRLGNSIKAGQGLMPGLVLKKLDPSLEDGIDALLGRQLS